MKLLQPQLWNERQQVVAIIAATVVALAALWYLVMLPQNVIRRNLERMIAEKRDELQRKNLLFGEEILREMQAAEFEAGRRMEEEWTAISRRLAAVDAVREDSGLRVGHIDLKVALFEARFRMNRKARMLGIALPRDLGMEETVPSGEDARKRLHQLRVLERLTDVALDLQVGRIHGLEVLPPLRHAGPDGVVFLEEYPVRIVFEADIGRIYEWFRATLAENRTFAVRHFRVDGTPRGAPETLTVTAVMSALVFPRDVAELLGPLEEKVVYIEPMGH